MAQDCFHWAVELEAHLQHDLPEPTFPKLVRPALQAALAAHLATDRRILHAQLPRATDAEVGAQRQTASTKLLLRLDSLRRVADAPDIGTALQTASRLAKFPLPVAMGAVLEPFEQTGDEAQQTPPALEELSGFPAKDNLVLRHILPPSTTIRPLRAVGICASTAGDLCLVGIAASDSVWPDMLPREAWFILSVGATPLCHMQPATISHAFFPAGTCNQYGAGCI